MARLIDADEFEVISWRAQGGSGDYKNGFDDGVNYVAQMYCWGIYKILFF